MPDSQSVLNLLEYSLQGNTANEADKQLKSIEKEEGFSLLLLSLIENNGLSNAIRLAAALYFKNFLSRNYIDSDGNYLLNLNDVNSIKARIIILMVNLDNKNLKVQVCECISIIADSDFPQNWINLIDELISILNNNDNLNNINGVLQVCHSIFKRWRPLFGSDELFLEIKFVLDKFSNIFKNLLVKIDSLIDGNLNNPAILEQLFENLLLLVKIYYDFNCQDIPEFFEDNMNQLMGIMHKYLLFPHLNNDENEEIDVLIKIKGSICDLILLYSTRYLEVFDKLTEKFIATVYEELVKLTLQIKFDILVSKYLNFLTAILKIEKFNDTFNNSLNEVINKVILPNITLRECDEELIEDDPIEYIKKDLENHDFTSRRFSTTIFLKELNNNNESLITEIVMNYINEFINDYNSDSSRWKQKDTAIYLFIAIASKGSITNLGITSTNLLINIIDFFSKNIADDLINSNNSILIIDAIKFINFFRNQLNKNQLLEILPILLKHLDSNEFIIYTYASVTLERVFALRNLNTNSSMFNKSDINNIFPELIDILFKRITVNSLSPEKLAENDYLMKCLMRCLIINNDIPFNIINNILTQLLAIIEIVSKNPSNPKFNHYCFESVGILIRNNKQFILEFISSIVPKFLIILGNDVVEFIPYIIQIFSLLLDLLRKSEKNVELPSYYRQLVKPLLSPSLWEYKGNIPAVTRLIIDIVRYDYTSFSNDFIALLGVFQKLISSKSNDSFGFDLLECILIDVDLSIIQQYLNQIATLLLNRLQTSKTTKFVKRFILFIAKMAMVQPEILANNSAINKKFNTLGPDFVIEFIDQLQAGLFGNVFKSIIIENIPKFHNLKEKKIVVIGTAIIVLQGKKFSENGPYGKIAPEAINTLYKSTTSADLLTGNNANDVVGGSSAVTDDVEFGSNFFKLGIVDDWNFDPIEYLNEKDLKQEFLRLLKKEQLSVLYAIDPLIKNELNSL